MVVEKKIAYASLLAGFALWFVDALLDPHFYSSDAVTVALVGSSTHDLLMRITIFVTFIAFGLVTASMVRKRRLAEEAKAQAVAELTQALNKVHALSGLLPICAYCKKIRDDRGYWSQIETYIRKHSTADFTHSICPECEKKAIDEFSKETKAFLKKQ